MIVEKRVVNRFRELLAIKERREGRRISQREVARVIGLSKYTVDTYARNEVTRFDETTLRTLCDYFGCEVGELLVTEEVLSPESESLLTAVA